MPTDELWCERHQAIKECPVCAGRLERNTELAALRAENARLRERMSDALKATHELYALDDDVGYGLRNDKMDTIIAALTSEQPDAD